MPNNASQPSSVKLLKQVRCPYCWELYEPERSLWIAEHDDLRGDSTLGPDEHQRFLPTRFTLSGDAIDAKGFHCSRLACPKCHLPVPRSMLEMDSFLVSIFGAPGSGKSFFLSSMTWELRRAFSQRVCISFTDADPKSNLTLSEMEEHLFLNPDVDRLVPHASLIEKTQVEGHHSVAYGNQVVNYLQPFLFTMQPQEGHGNVAKRDRLSRVVCLYDNSGESFRPGMDTTSNPVTRHMGYAKILLYVFDPTKDQRFRNLCKGLVSDPQFENKEALFRQESVLAEAASRVRHYARLPQQAKCSQPLVVILTKYDAWSHMLPQDPKGRTEPWIESPGIAMQGLDIPRIEERSQHVRSLLQNVTPEIVATAEAFSERVLYVPVSALGWQSEVEPDSKLLAIRPGEVQPYWVTVPLFYALAQAVTGLIPRAVAKGPMPPPGLRGAMGDGTVPVRI